MHLNNDIVHIVFANDFNVDTMTPMTRHSQSIRWAAFNDLCQMKAAEKQQKQSNQINDFLFAFESNFAIASDRMNATHRLNGQ